ncbi:hypothetical protein SD37_21380 [Amycolatopsis orientalis]|uniref:Secreted protein n=1 Tax=Amycolatopsis orientalis TaxID=31958 RepID=A0A193C0L9_AMYOR|nr:hypothetical protein SD37_21380 [Amycolatopsis orientalis]
MLLLLSAAVFFCGTAYASPDPPTRPVVTVTTSVAPTTVSPTELTTTVVVPSITAAPPTTKPPTTTKTKRLTADQRRAACRKDENQCYEPGTNIKCQTGGCVDRARGLTQRDVETERDKWLREHPGWCPVGETGAVAPC